MTPLDHSRASENAVPLDVRTLLPELQIVPSHRELIKRIQREEYLNKTEDVYHLNLVSPQGAIDQVHRIFERGSPEQKGIALGCLGYIHGFNGNYQKAFSAFNMALENRLSDDATAYVWGELSDLLRKLGYVRESLSILRAASRLTGNEKLRWRIRTYMGLCQKYTHPEDALAILEECESHYEETGDPIRLGMVVRHMASVYILLKQYQRAYEHLEKAATVAASHNLIKHQLEVTNDKGWLLIKKGDMEKARFLFKNLIKEDLSAYNMSLALQNLGYLEYECGNYREAIKYHSQSLRLTTRYEMRDMAFEDYTKLGLSHEKLEEFALADHFYSIGYQELMKEVRMGLPVLGFREKLLSAYVDFLDRNQRISGVDIRHERFGFAMNKTLREIRNIFHESLLNVHLEKTKNAPEMCKHLDIDTRTYFLYQKRLGLKRGKPRKAILIENPYFEQYIHSLVPLTWKEANRKFEKDLFPYLLSRYQHNKTRMARALGVSYQQVVMKTRESRHRT
ncbi:MAG: tetratricopeptide repeat protein [Fidelibacterota bacterium]